MPDGRRVWLGAAGTGTAFGLLSSLREAWGEQVWVVAADTNPAHLVAASAVADAFEQVLPAADPGFSAQLGEGLARHAVDTCVPILDSEIVLAAELRDAGVLPPGVTALAPPAPVARRCLDKLAMAEWLSEAGLPTPPTQALSDATWRPEGLIAKPRAGVGSAGVRELVDPSDLEALRGSDEDLAVQARCRAPEITIDVFRPQGGGAARAVCRERLEVKSGVAVKARVFEDPGLSDLSQRLAEGLGLTGTFCFQVMRHPFEDGWAITDVNPRPGAGTRMTVAAGVDVLAAMLADAWGEDPGPWLPKLGGERFVARQYAEYPVG